MASKRNVGTVTVDIINEGDHFRGELAGTDYARCGLREFQGEGHVGGFDHIYACGKTVAEVARTIGATLSEWGITGKIRVEMA